MVGQQVLCAELVGRTGETGALRDRVTAAASGRGGVVVLVGEAGAGKTRLVREVLGDARTVPPDTGDTEVACVLAGRAVPSTRPMPYRPLAEALLTRFRTTPPPIRPELDGFASHLRRLVPGWPGQAADGIDESPVLVSEAVVRVLKVLADGGPCVLVLEDLHWADAETVAAVEYFADALATEPVLCVGTTRPEGDAAALVERLVRRDPAAALPVGSLDAEAVDDMIAACLRTPEPPSELASFVRARSEGNPFLVEELLAGLVSSGELWHLPAGWRCREELTPRVPVSLAASIRQRMSALDPTTRRLIGAAALLGRRFAWELLPGITDLDGRAVVEALRVAVDAQLVEADGDGFVFRHALTREAVLDDLLPPDRRELARRAGPAVERAHPGLPGEHCELAADLAEAAGAPQRAAELLAESARRAWAAGALGSAEATVRRARPLSVPPPLARDIEVLFVEILVAAGKCADALEVGDRLLAEAPGDADGSVELSVLLARAAMTAGDAETAVAHVRSARAAVDPVAADDGAAGLDDGVDGLDGRLDVVAAWVALEQGDLAASDALARRARAAAAAAGRPAVEVEALQILGRVVRAHAPGSSDAWFHRAADLAQRHGLADGHLQAQRELALSAWAWGDLGPLRETRRLAARYGALVTVAVMDLSLADVALAAFDRDGSLAAAQACADASRRYGLATEPVAHLWLAGAHALAGNDAAMDAAIGRALARDPADPRILGDLYGRVLMSRAVLADDLGALRGLLDTMIEHVRAAPATSSMFPGRILWATLHTIEDDDLGAPARAEYAEFAARTAMPTFAIARDVMEAVALGRRGEAAAAADLADRCRGQADRIAWSTGMMHCQQLLMVRAAIRDGWGDPVSRLRESEAFFAAGGYERAARRCRTMMGEAGAPVPRRGRGTSIVPSSLRVLGVTSREVDVLTLVAGGRSNREIGEALVLSTKTVERHLASLFARTGVHDRGALGELARAHGIGSPGVVTGWTGGAN